MQRAVGLDVVNCFIETLDNSHCQDQVQVLGVPILFGGRLRLRGKLSGCFAAAQFDALGAHGRSDIGDERFGDVLVDKERLHGVADAWALNLGVDADALRLGIVGAGIDKGMTDALVMFDDRDTGVLTDKTNQAFATAWNDQVDLFFQLE